MNNKIHGNRVSPWYRSALEKHCWQWRSDADKKTQCAGRTLFSYEPNRQLDRMNRIDRRERKRLAQRRKDAERGREKATIRVTDPLLTINPASGTDLILERKMKRSP